MKIALAQINPTVGDLDLNIAKIITFSQQAQAKGADLVLFPELSISAYPPEDLLHHHGFLAKCHDALDLIKAQVPPDIHVVIGVPRLRKKRCFNMAYVLHQGQIKASYAKQKLPNYSVFDEKRYFAAGKKTLVFTIKNTRCAVTICEDLWHKKPARAAKKQGADILLNLNASPFHQSKRQDRQQMMRQRVRDTGLPIVYVNQVGGQDELVFDGSSFVMDERGHVIKQAASFSEDLVLYNTSKKHKKIKPTTNNHAQIYKALVLGVSDYVHKNGFVGVLLGLSGGIDSALTLKIAVDALGAERVEVMLMPSRFTSAMSIEDAVKQAKTLKVAHHTISIEKPFAAFLSTLAPLLGDKKFDVTEENIQARIRGIILMARSNQTGKMLLTTGNKSEMSVGYATLYGDMAGGFAPLKDVSKTLVFKLAKWCNRHGEIIPQRVITRPPSAELAAEQIDADSLPEYDILDPILNAYVEQYKCASEIIKAGFAQKTVERVIRMVDRNEYKRRQSPPGVRITKRAYGKDRRYPITNGFVSR